MTAEPTYTLTLTRTQLMAVRDACEAMARVQMGQMDSIAFNMLTGLPIDAFCEVRDALTAIGPMVTGKCPGHYATRNDQMKRLHEIAWGIYWAVRHPLYLDGCAERGEQPSPLCVLNDPPEPCGGQPVPEVRRG